MTTKHSQPNSGKDVSIEEIDADALRSGDPNTVRRLLQLVAQWARAHGFSREDAEDIAAITTRRAYESIGSFGGRSKVTTWVLGIAKHVAADLLRRPAINSVNLDDIHEEPASDEDVAELAYCQLVAQEALAALSDNEREAIQLTKFEGLSNQQAAERMGKTYDGFTCLLYRTHRKIGRFFDENM